MAAVESDSELEPRTLASGRPAKKAPMGFSAARSESDHIKKNIAEHAAAGGDDGAGADAAPLPYELSPHSYDKIVVKDHKGSDGPWFCYAWSEKKK
mmetsp:Transcript_47792/g.102448  ORF Transcript_47792/g.102448 Transcript_47792/m.102448 type:complete len:96 (+) Transcript_47792:66-353(+)